jgi:hypothetical protein
LTPHPPVANLPLGIGCFLVGPFGGRWADAGARRWNSSPAGRMVPGTLAAFFLFPPATLAYGWTLDKQLNLAGPLIASFFMGASICAFFPGCMSYVSILKQHAAAAAGGALQSMMFISGGLFIQITPLGIASMGLGPWISLLVGVCLFAATVSAVMTRNAIVSGAAARERLPTVGSPKAAAVASPKAVAPAAAKPAPPQAAPAAAAAPAAPPAFVAAGLAENPAPEPYTRIELDSEEEDAAPPAGRRTRDA